MRGRRLLFGLCFFAPMGCAAMYDWDVTSNVSPQKPERDGSKVSEDEDAGTVRQDAEGAPDVETVKDAAPDGDGGPCPECERVVFATVRTYGGGAMLGAANADTLCNDAATLSPLERLKGRKFRAWLSQSNFSASDRMIHGTGPYILPKGKRVAANWDALVSGTIENPINEASNGGTLSGRHMIWTGTKADATNGGATCGGSWTQANQTAVVGFTDATDKNWSEGGIMPCVGVYALYCFER